MLAALRRVFARGSTASPTWSDFVLEANEKPDRVIIGLAGLSGNGAVGLSEAMRRLYQHFDGKVRVQMSNLGGHTGHYADLVQSGFVHWVSTAWNRFIELAPEQGMRHVVLVGHSTGTLVHISIYLLWRFLCCCGHRKACRLHIDAIVPWAPAFGLRNRLDRIQLNLALACRLLLVPTGILALALWSAPWTAILALLLWVLVSDVLNQVTISNEGGDSRDQDAVSGYNVVGGNDLLSAMTFFVVAVTPWLVYALHTMLPPMLFYISMPCTLIILMIGWLVLKFVLEFGKWDPESKWSIRYRRLPVNTATSLIVLQYIVRLLLGFVRCPILLLVSGRDELVDNQLTNRLVLRRGLHYDRFELPDAEHYSLTALEQGQFATAVWFWLNNSVGWKDD